MSSFEAVKWRITNLYAGFRYRLDQQRYWIDRGRTYYAEKVTDAERRERARHRHERLASVFGKLDFQNAIEVGCGFGWNLAALRDALRGKVFVGCDFSTTQIDKARKVCGDGIKLDIADATSLPYRDQSFDLVYTVTCLQHIPPRKFRRAAKELKRVSRRYIVVLEADRGFAHDSEIRMFESWRNYWHDYDRAFAGEYRLTLHEDWGDFNRRVEVLGLRVYTRWAHA